jgi:microcystin-dependent protein
MTTPFLGEIRAFSFQFAPTGWLMCNGQLLPINQYQALFALLGTTYGGNGVQNFALPDLRGRVALHTGPATPLGQVQGQETVALSAAQLPVHNHSVAAGANGATNPIADPGPNVILGSGSANANGSPPVSVYSSAASNVALAPLAPTGGNQPHENRMPSLVMNYCIAMSGIFPSRS